MYRPIHQSRTNEEVSAIIAEQLDREKRIKVFSEHPEKDLIPAEKFLRSPLVTRERIFGCD